METSSASLSRESKVTGERVEQAFEACGKAA
jgi:hypothetical protein